MTTADPAQRCLRIAADGVVNQRLDGLWQTWLGCLRAPLPGARMPDARTDLVAGLLQSATPRMIVLRAMPVAEATALVPPRPSDKASLAANKRRLRSSRNGSSL
ncbi:MAG TPA: hypothetical protein VNR65_05750 [Geobacterales bacterium]|nr:hypothetical protein [Geobacterales bacterium]